jgi:hypothetical protein
MTGSNAIEVGIVVGEAEIGGRPELRGLVMRRANLFRKRARFVDPVYRAITDRHSRGRAFNDRRAGACGEQQERRNARAALLPEPYKTYSCHMTRIAKNLLAGH